MRAPDSRRLGELIRRIDEVRALSGLQPLDIPAGEKPMESLLAAADSLVFELERNRRRVIETTTLLAALTEVLSVLLVAEQPGPALTSLCQFVRGAFRLDWVFLGLAARDGAGRLEGPLVHRDVDGRAEECEHALDLDGSMNPLRAVLERHRSIHLTGVRAAEVVAGPAGQRLRVLSVLPIGREPAEGTCRLHGGEGHLEPGRLGGEPVPHVAVDLRQVPGLLVLGRYREEPLDGDHLALLESLGVTVGTVLENARLTRRLVEAIRFRDNVLESMVDGLVAVDAEGRVLAMNEVAASLLKLDRAAVLGRPLPAGLLEDDALDEDPLR
ncbi:MAG: PAS domain-containing protein, partial [Candidatus Eiseniibacteriota bacterium]